MESFPWSFPGASLATKLMLASILRWASEPEIHNHDREYGFRVCAKRRIHDVQLHIGE
jgi:hypothetical protein